MKSQEDIDLEEAIRLSQQEEAKRQQKAAEEEALGLEGALKQIEEAERLQKAQEKKEVPIKIQEDLDFEKAVAESLKDAERQREAEIQEIINLNKVIERSKEQPEKQQKAPEQDLYSDMERIMGESFKKAQQQKDLKADIADYEELKSKKIKEKYGMGIKDVPNDGNCFYHALSDQLPEKLKVTPEALRELAVDHIKNNKELYPDWLIEASSQDRPKERGGPLNNIDNYVKAHSQDKEYADQIIISALSRALDIDIVVAQPDAGPTINKQEKSEATAFLLFDSNAKHYQSLIPPKEGSAGYEKFTSLLGKVANAEIDADYKKHKANNLNQDQDYEIIDVKPGNQDYEIIEKTEKTFVNRLKEYFSRLFTDSGKVELNDDREKKIKAEIKELIKNENPDEVAKLDTDKMVDEVGSAHKGLNSGFIDKIKQFVKDVTGLFGEAKKIGDKIIPIITTNTSGTLPNSFAKSPTQENGMKK
jgi:hypothetical protein